MKNLRRKRILLTVTSAGRSSEDLPRKESIMIKRTFVVVPAMMLLVLPPVFGKGHRMKGAERPQDKDAHMEKYWDRIFSELDLSAEQKEKIRDIRHDSRKKRVKHKSEHRLKMLDLGHELKSDTIDDKKVESIINDLGELAKRKLRHRVDMLKAFRLILSEEQWDKMQCLKETREERGTRRRKTQD
jgi:Spy/CpxP family protein refolding chaperone